MAGEAEIGQSIASRLEQGARRLRRMRAQGFRPSDEETLLHLLRSVRVVGTDAAMVEIPLVFVDTWTLGRRNRLDLELNDRHLATPGSRVVATTFRRDTDHATDGPSAEQRIHNQLVADLDGYLVRRNNAGLLLDVVYVPESSEDPVQVLERDPMAYHPRGNGSPLHPMFAPTNGINLPHVVREIEGLVRLTFPLQARSNDEYRRRVATLFLGIRLTTPSTSPLPEVVEERLKELTGALGRQLSAVYRDLPRSGREPSHREDLSDGADTLHDQIVELAVRRGLRSWDQPEAGFKFLIAFRELNETELVGQLRYCITRRNGAALGAADPDVASLLSRFENDQPGLQDALATVFARSEVGTARARAEAYSKRCLDRVRSLVRGCATLEDVRRVFRHAIEALSYPTDLTPGDSLIRQGQAEVVRNWLYDPRACGDFRRYPPLLMAWESISLPKELLYSPVADGSINFGVCGVDADLLKAGGWPELEELIDDAGTRLRRIIRNKILKDAKGSLLAARRNGVSGERLWRLAVRRFRQLAYYCLPDMRDYHTKLVRLTDLIGFAEDTAWADGDHGQKVLKAPLDEGKVFALRAMPQRLCATDDGRPERDYLGEHLAALGPVGTADGQLYRLHLIGEPQLVLLVFMPTRMHSFAKELLTHFNSTCVDAFRLYRDESELKTRQAELIHTFVHSVPMLEAGLASLGHPDTDQLNLLAKVMGSELLYFGRTGGDTLSRTSAEDGIDLRELFDLLRQIHSCLRWCLERVFFARMRGDLESIRNENLSILETALAGSDRLVQGAGNPDLRISQSAALLLLWELTINLCKHTRSRIDFCVKRTDAQLIIEIVSDRSALPVTTSGRHGIEHIQRVAKFISVGFSSSPDQADAEYKSSITIDDVYGGDDE